MPSALLDTGDFSSTLSESDAENEEDDVNGKETKYDTKHTC